MQIAECGKIPFFAVNCEETTPLAATIFEGYTLLYIVYRGFLGLFLPLLGEGDSPGGTFGEERGYPEGTFWGEVGVYGGFWRIIGAVYGTIGMNLWLVRVQGDEDAVTRGGCEWRRGLGGMTPWSVG